MLLGRSGEGCLSLRNMTFKSVTECIGEGVGLHNNFPLCFVPVPPVALETIQILNLCSLAQGCRIECKN